MQEAQKQLEMSKTAKSVLFEKVLVYPKWVKKKGAEVQVQNLTTRSLAWYALSLIV